MTKKLQRLWHHCFYGTWRLQRLLSPLDLTNIAAAIETVEKQHCAELRVIVEPCLSPLEILKEVTPRQRAVELFTSERIWDTANNSGVLIYLLAADRAFEIVADRGLNEQVPSLVWENMCQVLKSAYQAGEFSKGILAIISSIADILKHQIPANNCNPNELPNDPLIL